jgi:hypothetical protein
MCPIEILCEGRRCSVGPDHGSWEHPSGASVFYAGDETGLGTVTDKYGNAQGFELARKGRSKHFKVKGAAGRELTLGIKRT